MNALAKEVLALDLSYISPENIVYGDRADIMDLIEIFIELYKVVWTNKDKNKEAELDIESPLEDQKQETEESSIGTVDSEIESEGEYKQFKKSSEDKTVEEIVQQLQSISSPKKIHKDARSKNFASPAKRTPSKTSFSSPNLKRHLSAVDQSTKKAKKVHYAKPTEQDEDKRSEWLSRFAGLVEKHNEDARRNKIAKEESR